jgi:ribosomal protein S18 acetylase RimI-like enzyme
LTSNKFCNQNSNSFSIKIFEKTEEMEVAFPLITQSHPNLKKTNYDNMLKEMIIYNRYKMLAGFFDGNLIAVAGYSIFMMLYCGRYMQVSNFVVDKKMRGCGIGNLLMNHLELMARELNCNKIVLDSYIENKKSHNLYYQQGFYIRGFHFMKDLIPFEMSYAKS